jgi:hypothetical protein
MFSTFGTVVIFLQIIHCLWQHDDKARYCLCIVPKLVVFIFPIKDHKFNGPWAGSSCVVPKLAATFVFLVKNQNVQCFLAYNLCVMLKLVVFIFPINNWNVQCFLAFYKSQWF